MDKTKSQQYNFAYEALPTLYHSQTNDFIRYIEKDGNKFLKFWWDHVGEQYDETSRQFSEGLKAKLVDLGKKNKLVLVTLPTPKVAHDPYLVCLIGSPERRFFLVRLPTTRAFVLELGDHNSTTDTNYFEVTPRLRKISMGKGSQATAEEFIKLIRKVTKK